AGCKETCWAWCKELLLHALHHKARLSDSQQCRHDHGHCRRLCFHMERWAGSCSNGRLRCCR
uniref:Beta-defensin-like domain-containing protein n=1 Tax=Anas zonorhyncha TaxID=75864 RepID=A0A8B9VQ77_9AVES